MPDPRSLLHHGACRQFVEGVNYRLIEGGCREWLGARTAAGYGTCPKTNGERLAHRASYVAAKGPIPEAHDVHHECRVKLCINPDHLEPLVRVVHLTLHGQEEWSHLNWDDIHEIRRIAKTGEETVYDIGERYGLGKSQIWNIIANLKWHDSSYTPGRPAVCEECGEDFVARRSNQKFCAPEHKERWNARTGGRRRRGQNPDGSDTRTYTKRAA